MGISRRALPASSDRAAARGAAIWSRDVRVERPALADIIEVRAPYCALQDVEVREPGRVTARVWADQSLDLACGDISAAEAVRHMSIAGSMACATYAYDPERRSYYLAERAALSCPEPAQPQLTQARRSGNIGALRVEAQHLHSSPHEALADCQLHDVDGTQLFGLRVTFKRVHAAVFQRVFASYRVEMRRGAPRTEAALSEATVRRLRQNPYRHPVELRITELDPLYARGELPSIAAEACAGHFAQYPTLPFSVLMEAFTNLGGAWLRKRMAAPELGYRLRSANISASKPVFAGQPLSIQGRWLEDVSPGSVRLRLLAHLPGGEEVVSMTAVLEGVASGRSTAAVAASPYSAKRAD